RIEEVSMPLRTLAALLLLVPASRAGGPQSIAIDTGRGRASTFVLAGRDSWQQLTVTGSYPGGKTRDLTRQAAYTVQPSGAVTTDPTGLVTPVKEGRAAITARVGSLSARVSVRVRDVEKDVPINFANEVVPIFTRFGCNAGGCHGKASGQNGFKLSLLGFEPGEDYEFLVKEGRGRRLFPAAPEQSLLLRKGTGLMAHAGGRKLRVASPFYRVLVRGIAQGAPYGRADDPAVRAIEVFPQERVLERGGEQQLVVLARLSDGSTRDVTRV